MRGHQRLVVARWSLELPGAQSHGAYMTDGKVANNALSPFVQSLEGEETQRRLWSELEVILEEVQPGVMQNVAG